MIDSHCHLTDSKYTDTVDQLIARAAAAGVSRLITIGTDPDDHAAVLKICHEHPTVRCAVGVHPNYSHEVDESELPRLKATQADPCVLALGEMGLDYFHKFADRHRQRKFFEYQLQLAVEVNKPVVIHCREAFDDFLGIMRNFPSVQAVVHCFTGTIDEARRSLDAGFLLGFTGVVTYKKADSLREVVKFIPADRMLVETDAPYLSPEPMRTQKLNEPALVVHTAAAIALVRQVSIGEIDRITTENAVRFFKWD